MWFFRFLCLYKIWLIVVRKIQLSKINFYTKKIGYLSTNDRVSTIFLQNILFYKICEFVKFKYQINKKFV